MRESRGVKGFTQLLLLSKTLSTPIMFWRSSIRGALIRRVFGGKYYLAKVAKDWLLCRAMEARGGKVSLSL